MWHLLGESWHLINEAWAAFFVGTLVILFFVGVASVFNKKQRAIWKQQRTLKRAAFQTKPRFARILLRFSALWVMLVCVVNLTAVVGTLLETKGFLDGVIAVTDMYSPFTISTYIVNILLLSPALGAAVWAGRVESRAAAKVAPAT